MKILIGVENFGKIKQAEIDISNFTIFVGNNNSGKTYMIQLIYGILQNLSKFELPVDNYEITEDLELEWGEEWIQNYERKLNKYLEEHKEEIVESIFHKSIPIKRLYFKIKDINEKITIQFKEYIWPEYIIHDKESEKYLKKNHRIEADIQKKKDKMEEVFDSITIVFLENEDKEYIKFSIEREAAKLMLNLFSRSNELLFFPASRTGMLLLYKYFFAEKDKRQVIEIGRNVKKNYGNEFGLSAPVYDFLQFLLRYTQNEMIMERNKELVDFIEKHLIHGSLQQQGEDTIYIPENTKQHIPLYLSSSMVNELTPMLKALTGAMDYKYFLYDEIETCLHPEKQGEMARLLIRLNNSGKKLIVSTHSDTMASKINLLLLLSFAEETKEEKQKKLDKLNLTKEDLLQSQNVHVYQFSNQNDGTSIVNELEFRKVPYTGYDFTQFMDSNQNLYQESVTIMG